MNNKNYFNIINMRKFNKNIILPKIDNNISLSSFGYKLSKSNKARKTSLKKASNKYGSLNVLRRVNLIKNYSK